MRMTEERQERMRRRERGLVAGGADPDEAARIVLEEEREAERVSARLAGKVLFAFADLTRFAGLGRAFVPDPETGEMRRVTRDEAALGWEQLLARFPDAVFHVEVPLRAVWRPPPEPRDPHWKVTKDGRAAYYAKVAASLQDHLNGVLQHLWRCVRTGRWWRLTVAKVEVKGEEVEEPGAAVAPLADARPVPAWPERRDRGGRGPKSRKQRGRS